MRLSIRGHRALLAAVILLLAWVTACSPERPTFQARVVDPPGTMADIALTTEDGQPFRLSDYRGEVVVVYVGYTHCPDVCPLTMSTLASARELLPPGVRDGVRVVMITADPARDTPEVLSEYVRHFDPTFMGVSGSVDDVLDALDKWGIQPVCSPPASDGAYSVSHPAISFVFNRDGLLRLQVPHDMSPEHVASDLQLVWREGITQ